MCKSIVKSELGTCPECELFPLILNNGNYVCKGGTCDVCLDVSEGIDNRDLDYLVGKYILKWKDTYVAPDYDGKNEGYVLTENGKIPENYCFPPKGKIPAVWFVPQYTVFFEKAFDLAKRCNLDLNNIPRNPRDIVIECLKKKEIFK